MMGLATVFKVQAVMKMTDSGPIADPKAVLAVLAENLPKQASGRDITEAQWLAFRTYVSADGLPQHQRAVHTAETCGVHLASVYNWKGTPWWKELWRMFVKTGAEDFLTDMMAKQEKVSKAYFDIVDGKRPDDKSTNAAMRGVQLLMEAGPDPLINRKPQVAITTNTQINNLKVDREALRGLTKEQLNEYARTGQLPGKE